MIVLKSPEEIAIMRAGGKILAQVLHELSAVVRPGITTNSLDQLARELIQQYPGATPAFLGYAPDGNKKYPAAICVSVNDEIIHGLPAERIIKEGDIVTLDLGIQYQNYFTDAAVTVAVGGVSALARTLLEATREALEIGLAEAKAGNTTGNIGAAIEGYIKKQGFAVVKEFAGHGVGRSVHEPPLVPNYGRAGEGEALQTGMTLAIEPMVVAGKGRAVLRPDGWTYATVDGSLAAQFEHTVEITANGPEVLTLL